MDWLKNLFGRQEKISVKIINRDPSRLRMIEWKSEPGLTKLATKFLNDPDFRMMIDVLRNEHLNHYVVPLEAPLEQRAILQARCEGYGTCLANLESLALLDKVNEPLEATYDEPELEVDNLTSQ